MPLPAFNGSGDLPAGLYRVTLQEAVERFGATTGRRKVMAFRLERIYRLAAATRHLG